MKVRSFISAILGKHINNYYNIELHWWQLAWLGLYHLKEVDLLWLFKISNVIFSYLRRKSVLQVFSSFFVRSIFLTNSQPHVLTKSNVCKKPLHCGCLLCLHRLMKFTYDGIFYVAFVTHMWVSLFTGIHCVICVVKKL